MARAVIEHQFPRFALAIEWQTSRLAPAIGKREFPGNTRFRGIRGSWRFDVWRAATGEYEYAKE